MLVACPFCRELFDAQERRSCAVCGVALVALDKLPPSLDALAEEDTAELPEERPLPLTFLGRGRGLLAGLAAAGLAAFFLPWVHVTMPDIVDYSGFALGRRLGWAWAAGVAWFVLLPVVATRRTILQMRGARVAATFLSAIPGVTASILLSRPPHGRHGVPLHFTFGEGLYASLIVSVAAIIVALFFGGRAHPVRRKAVPPTDPSVH